MNGYLNNGTYNHLKIYKKIFKDPIMKDNYNTREHNIYLKKIFIFIAVR